MSKTFIEVEKPEKKEDKKKKGLLVEVKVLEKRNMYFGRVEVLITPVSGSGEKWISNDRLIQKNG